MGSPLDPLNDVRSGEETDGAVTGVVWYRLRFPLMAVGMVSLLGGMWAGLQRIGWNLPAPLGHLAAIHGPLMVSGFLGTVIGLERAVALGKPWGYAAPFFSAAGVIAVISSVASAPGILFFILSSGFMIAIYCVILGRQFVMFNVTMMLGAVSWLVGNILWFIGTPIPGFVLWWGGFVVLTIAGERLELSRFMEPSRNARLGFVMVLGVFLAGLACNSFLPGKGNMVTGIGIAAMAAWLFLYDIARRTVFREGLTRFVAVCLLSGYVWLFSAGLILLFQGELVPGTIYDALLHSMFLGFAFSMIFGHAPIIFPAVLRVEVPFRNAFYAHYALLQLSLVHRIVADLMGTEGPRMWGGLLNALALVMFLANTVISVRKALSASA